AGRPMEQHVVERLAARPCRGDEDAEIVAKLALPDEVVEGQRAQRGLGLVGGAARAVEDALRLGAHEASSLSPPRIRPSMPAAGPSLRAARSTALAASALR